MASIDQVSIAGFSEPMMVADLRRTRCAGVLTNTGIYLIERVSDETPNFLLASTGGWFNGQDPSCPPDFIQANWVHGSHIVYIGKAAGKKGLQSRLRQLIDSVAESQSGTAEDCYGIWRTAESYWCDGAPARPMRPIAPKPRP